jgi:hypothetical protein
MKKNKMGKRERTEIKNKNLAESLKGSGLFLFKNRSNTASIQLPKMSSDGKKWVEPNQTWQGDSFFLKMIPREALLIKTIISPDQQKKEEEMNENKLLLDQPDQVTSEGKVEHVVPSEECVLNEDTKKKNKTEGKKNGKKLLTEDPIAGVSIIVE